jgi:hypothetical protein
MINRLAWRVQPIEQVRKRKQRRQEMEQRHKEFAEFVRKEQIKHDKRGNEEKA